MPPRPTLNSERLVIRPFTPADCDEVVRLAGERPIAEMTLLIPHPYARADAETWISGHQAQFDAGTQVDLAITRKSDGALLGAIGAVMSPTHNRAEMGYWIGIPHWKQGYATEAARSMIGYLFEQRGLNKVSAHHFAKNPASGRVLLKAGMQKEGYYREHVKKWGEYLDCVMYGMVRSDRK